MWQKEKRIIYLRKIKNFWIDFSHNKVGFVGLALLLLFIFAAAAAPALAPENPVFQKPVAARYALPVWMKIFPGYGNLPETQRIPFNLTEAESYDTITMSYPSGRTTINYECDGNLSEQIFIFEKEFDYQKDKPRDWNLQTAWAAEFSDLDYRFETYFRSANGSEGIIWGIDYEVASRRIIVTDMLWNIESGNDITPASATSLLLRIYYEEIYQERYDYYMSKYSTGNYTITPQFMAFTYEGFQNRTLIESENNPVYSNYLLEFESGQTNASWLEYWSTWNATDGLALWIVTNSYMAETWEQYIKLNNQTTYASSAYITWDVGKPQGATYLYKSSISWSEFITIWDLTFTSMRIDWDTYVDAMNKTDFTSPAYERWFALNETGQIEAEWTKYLQMWLDIQKRASSAFLNMYVSPLEAAPALSDRQAKLDALSAAQSSPVPTYYLEQPGTQTLLLKLYIYPRSENATLYLTFAGKNTFSIMGTVHGLLGATSFGYDVWTQLVHGARISLIVGSLAALLSTALGIIFGVTAGYVAGIADELIMRMVDILLCLPVLPLLLTLAAYWKPNVYYLVIIIAIFGWQGLARIIRSRVLSIREMPFIESAKASGASSSYLITRHLIPNVFPLAMASLVLSVPGAILSEAAISFLGFGDPFAPTWGKMLHEAQAEGAFHALAWWYIIPPGLAITLLCLAFVFIGHALDEIVNPRLRRRR